MALSKSSLRDRIIAELEAQGFGVGNLARDQTNRIYKLATAIANAVVDEIQQNAETSIEGEKIL
jgi:hypothetical protein